MEHANFTKIFWFLVGTVGFTLVYFACITFIPIPKENIRFADSIGSFLQGAILGQAFGFLVGGNPMSKKADVTTQSPSDNNTKNT